MSNQFCTLCRPDQPCVWHGHAELCLQLGVDPGKPFDVPPGVTHLYACSQCGLTIEPCKHSVLSMKYRESISDLLERTTERRSLVRELHQNVFFMVPLLFMGTMIAVSFATAGIIMLVEYLLS